MTTSNSISISKKEEHFVEQLNLIHNSHCNNHHSGTKPYEIKTNTIKPDNINLQVDFDKNCNNSNINTIV